MSQSDIARNRDDAQAQALYALAGRLFQGGNTGQSIAEGLQLGQRAYKGGMQDVMQEKLQTYQLQELMKKKKLEEQVKQLAPFTLKEQVTREAMPAQAALYGKPTDYPLMDDDGNIMPEASIIPARPAETALIPNQAVIGKLQELLPFKDFENLMQGIERRQKLGQPDYMTVDKTIFKKTPSGLEQVYKGNDYVTVDGAIYLKDDTAKNGLKLAVDRSGRFTGEFANLSLGLFKTDNPQSLDSTQFGKLLTEAKDLKKSGAGKGGDVYNYPAGAVPVGKEGQNALDKLAMSTGDRLARIDRIETAYKPEYLEQRFKGTQSLRAIGEKFGVTKLTPEQKTQLTQYTQFKQDSVRDLNAYINEITGAAMGQGEEADRIKSGVPNAGTGLFDGDSPTEFDAKLKNTLRDLRTVEARIQYIKNNGLKIVDVPLDKMPDIMRKREKELISSLGLDVTKPEDKVILKSRLGQEFGLMR
jgi:hypothetical protein